MKNCTVAYVFVHSSSHAHSVRSNGSPIASPRCSKGEPIMKSRRIITLLCIAAVSVPLFAGTPSNAFTLPVVGFFESGLDTYQSFVRVTNLRPNMAQAVRVEWLGANGDLTTRNAGIITVGPLESRFIPTLSRSCASRTYVRTWPRPSESNGSAQMVI